MLSIVSLHLFYLNLQLQYGLTDLLLLRITSQIFLHLLNLHTLLLPHLIRHWDHTQDGSRPRVVHPPWTWQEPVVLHQKIIFSEVPEVPNDPYWVRPSQSWKDVGVNVVLLLQHVLGETILPPDEAGQDPS